MSEPQDAVTDPRTWLAASHAHSRAAEAKNAVRQDPVGFASTPPPRAGCLWMAATPETRAMIEAERQAGTHCYPPPRSGTRRSRGRSPLGCLALVDLPRARDLRWPAPQPSLPEGHSLSDEIGCPASTTYVDSIIPVPGPRSSALWGVRGGMRNPSPACRRSEGRSRISI